MKKRMFDLIVAMAVLFLIFPFLIVLALLVRVKLGAPLLFKQLRSGVNGSNFIIYKFRTMTEEKDNKGDFLPDGKRITRFGKYLRKNSFDELPELINVLKGDMSMVGPRPLLPQYLNRYTPEQARRHEIKPGITGWAQINGRNTISWEEKFKLDVWYVDHHSLWMDIKILFLTVGKVLRGEGESKSGLATTPEFMGENLAAYKKSGTSNN